MQEFTNETPKLCINCGECELKHPASIWDEMPPKCGFLGWIFQEREKIKQEIRKKKEKIVELKSIIDSLIQEDRKKAEAKIKSLEAEIKLYAKHGSDNW